MIGCRIMPVIRFQHCIIVLGPGTVEKVNSHVTKTYSQDSQNLNTFARCDLK